MDDLFGNIQLEANEPIVEEEGANKKKRKATVEISDEFFPESSAPEKKKKKICPDESIEEELTINILPRKMQCSTFLEFCYEYVYHEISDVHKLPKFTHKNFARCKLTDSEDSINSLCQVLPVLLPNWEGEMSDLTKNGTPIVLIISPSALRCLELIREAKQGLGKDCVIAKLFAKQIKISTQQSFLASRVCHLATGTPERLLQLFSKNENIANSLKLIILDWQRKDLKKRRLIDIPETRKSLASLLREYLIPLALASKARFFIF